MDGSMDTSENKPLAFAPSAASAGTSQGDFPLPFSGLGFDLSAILAPGVTLIRVRRPSRRIPFPTVRIPHPAGGLLLARLSREIRGR